MPPIKKKIPWQCREHLFTPENITKLETICAYQEHCIYQRPPKSRTKPRALRNGPVIWIMRDGKPIMMEEE